MTTTVPQQADDEALSVVVSAGERTVLVVDAGGRILAPETSAERAQVAVALARASAALAVLPTPSSFEQVTASAIRTLGNIGTPAAADAIDALHAAAEVTSAALQHASAVMMAAVPTLSGKS